MLFELDDARAAGRLIELGLRPRARPAQQPEYARLIDRFLDQPEFRGLVRAFAESLGLEVLDAGQHGVVLGPREGSIFALRPADFRATQTVDDRLIDGLVQVAIAATVFPRPRDLDDDATYARPPVTIEEIDENLRILCRRFADEARGGPDPAFSGDAEGLDEAWRVYDRRLSAMETKDERSARRSTRRIIESNLERLRELGSFTRETRGETVQYQPTWRYQVLVRELAATAAYVRVRRALGETKPEDDRA